MAEEHKEEWVALTRAASILGINHSVLSKLASRGAIETKRDEIDRRLTLVNLTELRKKFAERDEHMKG